MKSIFRPDVESYDTPRFPKDVVKNAFAKDPSWELIKEEESYLEYMKKGYESKNGFFICFKDQALVDSEIECEGEDSYSDFPMGEAVIINMQPWVAVDTSDAADYKSADEIVKEANFCVTRYGEPYKI